MSAPKEVWCSDFGGDVGGSWRVDSNAAHPVRYLRADLVDELITAGEGLRDESKVTDCIVAWDRAVAALKEGK
jgi:hypothetical protein